MPALTLSVNVNGTVPMVAFNDIYLDQFGNISLSYDLDAVLQNCAQVARTRLGEEVFNTGAGIPYLTTVFVGVPNLDQFNAALRAAWLAVTGVVEVISLITTVSASQPNTLQYTAIIRTIYGTGGLSAGI